MITEGPEIINNGNFHYTRGQRSDYGGALAHELIAAKNAFNTSFFGPLQAPVKKWGHQSGN